MKYSSKCDQCGHVQTIYSHTINQPLVNALRQLVDFYEQTQNPCNLQKDLRLTKNQYNNFQKLQHFYVVKRTKEGYFPTLTGIDFIYGIQSIPRRVATLNNSLIPPHHPYWEDKAPENVYVTQIDEISYKKRPEYQEEKSLQQKLILN